MDIPQGKWARGRKLLGLASQMALKEAKHLLPGKAQEELARLQTRIEQTRLLVETLTQMKGAAMKAGQLLGLEALDIFPPEVAEILSRLESSPTGLPPQRARELLAQELGDKLRLLTDLDLTPMASASIGQVHRARFEQQELALKLQFPGVADTIDSDVALLRGLVEKLAFVAGKKADLGDLFDEIRQTLHQETDYQLEIAMLEEYRRGLAPLAGIVVPRAHPHFSTARLLTMEFIEGIPLKRWATGASAQARQLMGERILELFLHEFMVLGLVQTDPNWGNFLVTPRDELALLDFGATKRYSESFRQTYRGILRASMAREKEHLLELSYPFGLIDPREGAEAKELYLAMMSAVVDPFRHPGPLDFSQETYSKVSKDASLKFLRALRYSPPPKDLIFLHRKLGGVFQMLKRLEVKLDLRKIWPRMVSEAKGPLA